ncbi:hypothetical protein OPS25_07085 [Alteromonas ponticola]|uniref:Uncharacterized protein n=1 Tax=Alteromonas aquimaris TaxID=2998417 RepID=A0ABT3P6V0_9ALTE|nr:hypothetical protein [Alteromonas aquimaris]MCW8108255.1 hypothetical protein [Alteromonas aquimaris]
MSMFISKELHAVKASRRRFDIAKRKSDLTTQQLKLNSKLLIASPVGILTFFSIGAYKGATTDSPPSRRRQAILIFLRSTLMKFLS